MLCLVPWLCFTIQIYYLAGGKHWSLGFVCKLAFRLHFYWTLSKVVNSTLNLPTYYLNKMDNMSDAKKLLIYEIIICFAWFHDCVSPFKYITSQEENIGHWFLSVNWKHYRSIVHSTYLDNFVCKLAFRLHFYWTLSKVVNSTLNLPTYYLNKMDNMSDAKKLLIYEIIICFAWFHDCVSPFKYITSQEENIGHLVLFVNWLFDFTFTGHYPRSSIVHSTYQLII